MRVQTRWIVALALVSIPVLAGTRNAQWTQVEEARQKGLPRTAIEALQPIIDGAVQERAYAEAIRAIGLRVALEGEIEGNKPEEKIVRLEAEIAKCPAEMRPVMEAILAGWYWQYFERNSGRFSQRTRVESSSGPDLRTWDRSRILAAVDAHFTAALADSQTLKSTPISQYDALLPAAGVSDAARPTLFDFLAYEALRFYERDLQAGPASEDKFQIEAQSPIFDSAENFRKWHPEVRQKDSSTAKAIQLCQALLDFHAEDRDPTAYLDADLHRLIFGRYRAVGEDKDERCIAALQHFVSTCRDHEISAKGLAEWAQMLQAQQRLVEAHRLARQGMSRFPSSPGGAQCSNIVEQIEAKSASATTERVWNAAGPRIQVTYRNVTRIYFRVVRRDFESDVLSCLHPQDCAPPVSRQVVASWTPVLAWEAALPATRDFQVRTEELAAPTRLEPGYYFIVSSYDSSFTGEECPVGVTAIWVSDLALVVRARPTEGIIEGIVMKGQTGEPVSGATIRTWRREIGKKLKPYSTTATNPEGVFTIHSQSGGSILVLAESAGQRLADSQEHWCGSLQLDRSFNRTVFFTDRSLYRPGQSIYYKGICTHFDSGGNRYGVDAGRTIEVLFRDGNGQVIDRASHVCNAFGSFDGVFTAPRDRILGQMSLSTEDGAAIIRVEEYKRPKFEVVLSAPEEAAALDEAVAVSGKAKTFSGTAVGGAEVRWRVVRQVQFPIWCWWGPWNANTQSQAIAHGRTITEADGSFRVEFRAIPDRGVPEKDEPAFEFRVNVDVTDGSGETRSRDRVVRAGYTALRASLTADDWQTRDEPVRLGIETTSLDGVPQAARGVVKVYRLKSPAAVVRGALDRSYDWNEDPQYDVRVPDLADPNSWPLGHMVQLERFATDMKGRAEVAVALPIGSYRAILETTDRRGKSVGARQQIFVVDPTSSRSPIRVASRLAAPKWRLEPGETFTALWGTGYSTGRAFVEIEHHGRRLRGYWTEPQATQEKIEQYVDEEFRGGFTLRVTFVRENRTYVQERIVEVPWSNKVLAARWEHFRSKLEPGGKETWTAVISDPTGAGATVEMVAGLYDASLDQYSSHNWLLGFNGFRQEAPNVQISYANIVARFSTMGGWRRTHRPVPVMERYRAFPWELRVGSRAGSYKGIDVKSSDVSHVTMDTEILSLPIESANEAVALNSGVIVQGGELHVRGGRSSEVSVRIDQIESELGAIVARRNLAETAFFLSHLRTDSTGVVRIEFTMPEGLTTWKFLGFAHDPDLRSAFLRGEAITAKDLMVEPNPPRFVREGDVIEFPVKVSNQSSDSLAGHIRLAFSDARTLESKDAVLGNLSKERDFVVPPGESRSTMWRITIPDGCEFLTYKAVASARPMATTVAGATVPPLSDGEENFLPVLSRRILVTESLPLPMRGAGTKHFAFKRLIDAPKSSTLRHQSLTLQMVSQPAWYAVMALPYLMEYPYECSEQTFNRLFANELARHIANSDPKVRRVFDQWKGTPALDSPLEKNQDIKSVMLEATPWLRQAAAESQARRNVGLLFDANRLDGESNAMRRRLADMQTPDGMWPWFPGGRANPYITLYITTGFGRLRALGAAQDVAPAVRSLRALDRWMAEEYEAIVRAGRPGENHLSPAMALYLYGRSFFLTDQPVADPHRRALEYWMNQATRFWLALGNRQSQAHVAIGLKRWGDDGTAQAILKSLGERSVHDDELGMFWRDTELSWWWYRAPIETQAMMIEAFDVVADDERAVEDCKVWLLKQKQTQDWKTTKATADAIYALLLRGTDLLSSDALVQVALGDVPIVPEKTEAGTGFYEQRFAASEIEPGMGRVTVRKQDRGVSWGSLHWQYLEDMTRITPYAGTPLAVTKSLYTKEATAKGMTLVPVTSPLAVGDELVVRIEIRTDRDMEYVHLEDQRGSGTEPVNVLSRYKYQDGLGYYESTRDCASHFFIDYLPKGVYVFEYSSRIQLRGAYQTGMAAIQCMYAPEFNSHSESFVLNVR